MEEAAAAKTACKVGPVSGPACREGVLLLSLPRDADRPKGAPRAPCGRRCARPSRASCPGGGCRSASARRTCRGWGRRQAAARTSYSRPARSATRSSDDRGVEVAEHVGGRGDGVHQAATPGRPVRRVDAEPSWAYGRSSRSSRPPATAGSAASAQHRRRRGRGLPGRRRRRRSAARRRRRPAWREPLGQLASSSSVVMPATAAAGRRRSARSAAAAAGCRCRPRAAPRA